MFLHLWKTQLNNCGSKDLSTFEHEQSEHLRRLAKINLHGI